MTRKPRVMDDPIAVFYAPPVTPDATTDELESVTRRVMAVLLADRDSHTYRALRMSLRKPRRDLLPTVLQALIDTGAVNVHDVKAGPLVGQKYSASMRARLEASPQP